MERPRSLPHRKTQSTGKLSTRKPIANRSESTSGTKLRIHEVSVSEPNVTEASKVCKRIMDKKKLNEIDSQRMYEIYDDWNHGDLIMMVIRVI